MNTGGSIGIRPGASAAAYAGILVLKFVGPARVGGAWVKGGGLTQP